MEMKSRHLQKAYLEPLLNVHTKFKRARSIWRGGMRGTNSQNEKKRPKNHTLGAVKGWKEAEKTRPTKGTSKASTQCTCLISSS